MKNNIQREINWLIKEKYKGQINKKNQKNFEQDLFCLKRGEPIDYIIGFKDFLGCKIDLSYKPLIPRQETEFWTSKFVVEIKQSFDFAQDKTLHVLDIFAGSGCVGLAIIKNVKKAKVVFVDNDKKAILQIKKNLKLNFKNQHSDILENVRVLKSDLFKKLKIKNYRNYFYYILANPPYIPINNKDKIEKSVLKYEPYKALFGGKDGLFYINKFLKQAKNYLSENGVIYMEFDSAQKNTINKLLKKYNYQSWKFYKDQFNKWRFLKVYK